jgi:alkaline phosphatase
MKKVCGGAAVLGAAAVLCASANVQAAPPTMSDRFKNVIVMVPDGCGIAHFTAARWYKGEPLACDALHVAQVRTYGSNSLITDSAPAATAFASGYKSHDKYVGILPPSYDLAVPTGLAGDFSMPGGWENRPVASVLEAARLMGKATGVIATSTTSHATPAAYTSHWYSRSNENIIMEQQVYQGLDILMGGGGRYIAGTRPDGESLADTLAAMGYHLVNDKTEMAALADTVGKVWGHFTSSAMAADFDRQLAAYADQPSLAEMTQKTIDILSTNAKGSANGFFLVVEGSQVDWASHANDPVGVMSEYLAFDAAVQAAVDFAGSSNTLVLVVSDHDNGGMSIGDLASSNNYSSMPFATVYDPSVLMAATLTGVGLSDTIGSGPSSGRVTSLVGQYYGISDLTQDEIDTLVATAGTGDFQYAIGPMISQRAAIGWTTYGHTGNDVPLYYYGTDTHFKTIENTDIAHICAQAMDIDLAEANDTLFADASVLFASATTFTIDTTGLNSSNGSLTVVDGGKTAVFPFNKNEAWVDGVKHVMNGLTVYSYRNGKVYLPKQSADVVAGLLKVIPEGLLKTGEKMVSVEIFSPSGRLVRSMKVRTGMINLRTLGLADGTYLLRVNKKAVGSISAVNNAFFRISNR